MEFKSSGATAVKKDASVGAGQWGVYARVLLGATVWLAAGAMRVHAQAESGAGTRQPEDDFVVATWNVEWFYDEYQGDNFSKLAKEQSAPSRDDWNWKRDTVAAGISKMRPDVIAFQEIEGQRSLYYLTQALKRVHQAEYGIGFVEGTDYYTEQDVGFLIRDGIEMTRIARYRQSRAMYESDQYRSVSKHAEVVIDVPVGDEVEQVTLMTIHLRARAEREDIRKRQARLVHAWLSKRIAAGENIIVLGDTNSEATDYPPVAGSDVGALAGLDTPDTSDDLVDLGKYLAEDKRPTHLLPGKHYDRVLVSPSLLEDAPGRADLVFRSIETVPDVSIRGAGVDTPDTHWEQGYWNLDAGERDLSDHIPVVVRFAVQ